MPLNPVEYFISPRILVLPQMLEAMLFLDGKNSKTFSSVLHEIRIKSELPFLFWCFNFFLVADLLPHSPVSESFLNLISNNILFFLISFYLVG